jgi:hypothetical protein
MSKSLDTTAAASQHSRRSPTHSAVIDALDGNALSSENWHLVGDVAIDVVPDQVVWRQRDDSGASATMDELSSRCNVS